ncbi:type II secretion system (T2SS), F family protein, partial [Chlamydia psittaci C1/97]
SFRRT